tara:strand:+ start:292 stop:627 length:336 start_codon:yes stop_codon:yes gene_type:complete
MNYQFGEMEIKRSSSPISSEDVKQTLTTSGKEIICLAWSSLFPNDKGGIEKEKLATWFCEIFNMEYNVGNGNDCIKFLKSIGIVRVYNEEGGLFTNDYYVVYPTLIFKFLN